MSLVLWLAETSDTSLFSLKSLDIFAIDGLKSWSGSKFVSKSAWWLCCFEFYVFIYLFVLLQLVPCLSPKPSGWGCGYCSAWNEPAPLLQILFTVQTPPKSVPARKSLHCCLLKFFQCWSCALVTACHCLLETVAFPAGSGCLWLLTKWMRASL